jgi:4-amino-4-deoxy-L-arabinose transferase-like glycosyltransferase
MPPGNKLPNRTNKFLANLPLIVILICAIVLRLVFFTGMVRGDDINYANAAYELSNGRTNFDYWLEGTSRIGLYGPVALLYVFFGSADAITLAFPFLCSFFSVLIMFGIGNQLDGRRAGLLAALLWACLPLDIFLATDLLPDGPLATFTAGAIFFLLLAERRKNHKVGWLVASVICLVWAILIKPTATITLVFILVYGVIKLWPRVISSPPVKSLFIKLKRSRLWVIFAGIIFLFALGISYALLQGRPLVISLSRTATDLSRLFLTGETGTDFGIQRPGQIDLLAVLGPLALISSITFLIWRYKPARFALVSGGVYFLYYEWGSLRLDPRVYGPAIYIDERNLLFLLVPFVLLAAIYLASKIEDDQAEKIVVLAAVLVLLIALIFGRQLINSAYLNEFELIKIAAILGFFVLPVVVQATSLAKRGLLVGIVTFLVCVALARLTPPFDPGTWQMRRDEIASYRQAANYLLGRPGKVYVSSDFQAGRLNYVSDFALGFDWGEKNHPDPKVRIQVGSPQLLESGDFFVSSIELTTTGLDWVEVYRTTKMGSQLIIYSTESSND